MNPLEGLIQQLLGQAGPRGATFAGRYLPQGQPPGSLQEILARSPQGEVSEGGTAPLGTQLEQTVLQGGLLAAPNLMKTALVGSLSSLAKGLKGKFKTAIVNEEGHPKLLYHGTPEAFPEFDLSKAKPGLYGKGFYLTDDPSITEGYATPPSKYLVNKETGQFLAPNVRPAFVKMQNPFDIEGTYPPDIRQKLVTAIDGLYQHKNIPYERDLTNEARYFTTGELVARQIPISPGGIVHGANISHGLQTVLGPEAFSTVIKKLGYDGITHIGGQISGGKPHRVYIAFDPKQVVSAFDPSLQALEQQLGPETMKALTTPGKSTLPVLRIEALHSLAVSNPKNAITQATRNNASPQELAYLQSLLESLGDKSDRFLTPAIRNRALQAAKKVK